MSHFCSDKHTAAMSLFDHMKGQAIQNMNISSLMITCIEITDGAALIHFT